MKITRVTIQFDVPETSRFKDILSNALNIIFDNNCIIGKILYNEIKLDENDLYSKYFKKSEILKELEKETTDTNNDCNDTNCPCRTVEKACCTCVSMHCHTCIGESKYIQGHYCSNCGRKLK